MFSCPSCSQENPGDSNFCAQCGQALVRHTPEPDVDPELDADLEPEDTPSQTGPTSLQLLETFIGPSKSLQFSLSTWWTWRPAFLVLQRKIRSPGNSSKAHALRSVGIGLQPCLIPSCGFCTAKCTCLQDFTVCRSPAMAIFDHWGYDGGELSHASWQAPVRTTCIIGTVKDGIAANYGYTELG